MGMLAGPGPIMQARGAFPSLWRHACARVHPDRLSVCTGICDAVDDREGQFLRSVRALGEQREIDQDPLHLIGAFFRAKDRRVDRTRSDGLVSDRGI
jgi:hypothetical protein